MGVARAGQGPIASAAAGEFAGILFTEWDWTAGEPFGTAIPLRALDDEPPKGKKRLLAWLAAREAEHEGEIEAAWKIVLGEFHHGDPGWRRRIVDRRRRAARYSRNFPRRLLQEQMSAE